ncbi:MAG TPA: ribonuclease P protein component [Candidatus Angelobacter sp.]
MSTLSVRPAVKETSKRVSQGFPREARLLKHSDFQAVYQKGRKHFSSNMTAFYCECDRPAGPRVGFTVGKVLGGAVVRNRIRRRMRAVVRRHLSELARPVDLVLHPRKSVLTLKFIQLDAEIKQVFAAVQRGQGR